MFSESQCLTDEEIDVILQKPLWSKEKIEEACRGMVNASCDDPPGVLLEFWFNLAMSENYTNIPIDQIRAEHRELAKRGASYL